MNANNKLYNRVFALAIFTIIYNFIEGVISIYFGISDDALTLFGFGADSFVETISAVGIAFMILRIKKNKETPISKFEETALKITGWCFYGLALTLIITGALNIINESKPESTLPGIIISVVSIISMYFLIYSKRSIGKKLNSAAILADANCNLVCVYMSIILLISSALYYLWDIAYIDLLGTAGIVYFAITEGKEALEKAKTGSCSCSDCDH